MVSLTCKNAFSRVRRRLTTPRPTTTAVAPTAHAVVSVPDGTPETKTSSQTAIAATIAHVSSCFRRFPSLPNLYARSAQLAHRRRGTAILETAILEQIPPDRNPHRQSAPRWALAEAG
jgi:hypothetical protein